MIPQTLANHPVASVVRPPLVDPDFTHELVTAAYGRMFWLRRNRFVGSYVRLSARSRSYFASP
jgi:hypothetical protein